MLPLDRKKVRSQKRARQTCPPPAPAPPPPRLCRRRPEGAVVALKPTRSGPWTAAASRRTTALTPRRFDERGVCNAPFPHNREGRRKRRERGEKKRRTSGRAPLGPLSRPPAGGAVLPRLRNKFGGRGGETPQKGRENRPQKSWGGPPSPSPPLTPPASVPRDARPLIAGEEGGAHLREASRPRRGPTKARGARPLLCLR